MSKTMKLSIVAGASIFLLSGCFNMGQQASVREKMQDDLGFTSTHIVSGENKCVRLTQPFQVTAGSVTFSLPAGNYIGKKKNDTGYFYSAPDVIRSSNWIIVGPQQGIYLNNQLTQGNLYADTGVLYRPIRGAVLPSAIFRYLRNC